jgi:hypothetical protein
VVIWCFRFHGLLRKTVERQRFFLGAKQQLSKNP